MKNIFRFLMAALLIIGAVSCTKEDISSSLAGGEVEVTLSVDVPELGTRAFGDGMTVNQLFIAVYEKNGTTALPISHIEGTNFQGSEAFSGGRATVTMVLLKDKTYDLVFWAQKSGTNAYDVNLADGRKVVANYGAKCNLEDRDAFFLIRNEWTAGADETTFTLKRPFAQINVANSDEDVANVKANGATIATSAMTVKTKVANTLDMTTGEVSGEADAMFAANAIPTEEFYIDGYNYLAMNYLLVNEKELVDLEFVFTDDADVDYTRNYYAVPVQRNYRTNILGQIISSPIDFTVVIDPIFKNQYDILYLDEPAHPATAEEFLALMENSIIGEVNLDGSIAVETPAEAPFIIIGDKSDVTLNLNNAPITSGDASNYGLIVRNNAQATINDADLNSKGGGVGVTNGANVTFSGNVDVSTTSTSGRYNFYVDGNSTLTITEGNFSWDTTKNNKRAYIYVTAGSTVYVKGGNFGKASTRSGYSAGIMGDGTVIITGGTFKFDPTTWVAEGYKAVKNGDTWYVTPENTNVAATADDLVAALEDGKDVVLLNDVKIDPASMSNAYGATGINVKNGQTIDGNGHTLDIKGAGGTWDSGISTTGGLIKNITVTGSFRGIFINHNSDHCETVVLENVILNGTTYTISCDQGKNQNFEAYNSTFNGWTSYAKTIGTAKFDGCSFGAGNGYSFCRPYAPSTFVNCEFEAGYKMDPRAAVTFENCTLGGVALTAENLATLVTSNIANATVK